jgi:surface protein
MSYLFKQCKSLKTIPAIESWNISKSIKTDEMFEGVSKHLIPSKFK